MTQTRDWTASSFFLRAWHVRRRISKQSLVICKTLPGYATSTVLLPHDWGHHWWPCSNWCFLIPGVCLLAWMGRDTPGILGWCINVSEFLGLQSCLDAPCSQRWGTSDNHDDHNQLKWCLAEVCHAMAGCSADDACFKMSMIFRWCIKILIVVWSPLWTKNGLICK